MDGESPAGTVYRTSAAAAGAAARSRRRARRTGLFIGARMGAPFGGWSAVEKQDVHLLPRRECGAFRGEDGDSVRPDQRAEDPGVLVPRGPGDVPILARLDRNAEELRLP